MLRVLEKCSTFVSKYMAVFVIIIAAVALFQPWTFKWAAHWVTILLGVVMFGMGMTMKLSDCKLVFQRPKDVLLGAVCQFTIMPLLAYLLCRVFSLPADLAAGVHPFALAHMGGAGRDFFVPGVGTVVSIHLVSSVSHQVNRGDYTILSRFSQSVYENSAFSPLLAGRLEPR